MSTKLIESLSKINISLVRAAKRKIPNVLRNSGIDPSSIEDFFETCKAGWTDAAPSVRYTLEDDILIKSFEDLYEFFLTITGSSLERGAFKTQFKDEITNILAVENYFTITLNTVIETNGVHYFDSLLKFYGSFAKVLLKKYIKEFDYSCFDNLTITKYTQNEHKLSAIQKGEIYLGTPKSYWMASGGAGDYMEARNLLWLMLPGSVELDRYLSYAIIDHKGFVRSKTNSIHRSRMTTTAEQILESIEAQPAFMFCCAKSQNNTVKKDFGYDDSYEIACVSGILNAVSSVLEDVFGDITAVAGIVDYQDKPETFTSSDQLHQYYERDRFTCHDEYFLNLAKIDSYFSKPTEYGSQREFRMIWMPTEFLGHKKVVDHKKVISGDPDHILISSEEISKFLR